MNLASCFIRVPGSNVLRLTAAGRAAFATRFARQGFNIDDIKTVDQFLHVHNLTMAAELRVIGADKNSGPELKALLARAFD